MVSSAHTWDTQHAQHGTAQDGERTEQEGTISSLANLIPGGLGQVFLREGSLGGVVGRKIVSIWYTEAVCVDATSPPVTGW